MRLKALMCGKADDCWTKVAKIINPVFHFAHFTLPNGFLTWQLFKIK